MMKGHLMNTRTEHHDEHAHAITALTATLEVGFKKLGEDLSAQASNLGVRDRGAEPRALSATPGGTLLTGVPNRLMGWLLQETTGTNTATLTLYDGDSVSSAVLTVITLAPNESIRDWFGSNGIALSAGLFAVTAGAVSGSVLLVPGS